jgi:branched-chain amino acid transport system substrate-binding protein
MLHVCARVGEKVGIRTRRIIVAAAAATLLSFFHHKTTSAVEPLKIGFSMPTSGAAAQGGKQLLIALQLWRDDVNFSGGLLGRPVELVYYDDQSSPANVPGIYRKLISVDKVDLIIGPYSTNMAAAAMRVLMEFNRVTISILGIGVNRIFSYWRYFAMAPVGPEGLKAFSKGFLDLAAEQMPKPQTVAIIANDAEPTRNAADGARANAATDGLNIIYDQSYQQTTTDFNAISRQVQAANADVVFVSALPSDTIGIVRAAKEIGLTPKMFGGAMLGSQITAIKAQLGPLLDGIVTTENFVPASTLNFPGITNLLKRYRSVAAGGDLDPFGYEFVPFGYAAGQVLAQAVEATKSLDSDKLAEYVHGHRFATVVGPIEYGRNGEWIEARNLVTQFRHVAADDLEQFADGNAEPIVWPPQYKTDDIIYPYTPAKK